MTRTPIVLASLALLDATAWALPPAPSGAPQTVSAERSGDLVEIPEPALDSAEPAVAQLIRDRLERARALAADTAASVGDRSTAFAELGRTLLLYELLDPAEAALENAARLAPGEPSSLYYLGTIHQERGELDAARDRFAAVLELDADNLAALVRLGDVERAANRPEAARNWYDRALTVAPESPAAHWGLGQLAAAAGDPRAAVRHFEAVLAAQPEAGSTHYALAIAYRELGEEERAREHLARRGEGAVRLADPLIDALRQYGVGASLAMQRGIAAYTRGHFETAVEAYREAVAADPENTTARHALATSLARLGRFEEGARELEIVVRQKPDSGVAQYNLGAMYSQMGDPDGAIRHFERALELSPELTDARFNLALLLEARGQLDRARDELAEILRRDPQDTSAAIRHALLTARLGRPESGESDLRGILSVDPENSEARMALAGLLADGGRPERALDEYRRLLASAEDHQVRARAHLAVGRLLAIGGDVEAALPEVETTVELMPGVAEARLTLGELLARAGRFAEAAEQFAAAIELEPPLLDAHLGRALALLLAGRDAEARSSLEESLSVLSGDAELTHLLARLLATSADASVRDGRRALELAQTAAAAQPSGRNAETVAMALAELGRFEEAARLQRQILAAARKADSPDQVPIERRLAAYDEGRPARAPWLDARSAAPDDG